MTSLPLDTTFRPTAHVTTMLKWADRYNADQLVKLPPDTLLSVYASYKRALGDVKKESTRLKALLAHISASCLEFMTMHNYDAIVVNDGMYLRRYTNRACGGRVTSRMLKAVLLGKGDGAVEEALAPSATIDVRRAVADLEAARAQAAAKWRKKVEPLAKKALRAEFGGKSRALLAADPAVVEKYLPPPPVVQEPLVYKTRTARGPVVFARPLSRQEALSEMLYNTIKTARGRCKPKLVVEDKLTAGAVNVLKPQPGAVRDRVNAFAAARAAVAQAAAVRKKLAHAVDEAEPVVERVIRGLDPETLGVTRTIDDKTSVHLAVLTRPKCDKRDFSLWDTSQVLDAAVAAVAKRMPGSDAAFHADTDAGVLLSPAVLAAVADAALAEAARIIVSRTKPCTNVCVRTFVARPVGGGGAGAGGGGGASAGAGSGASAGAADSKPKPKPKGVPEGFVEVYGEESDDDNDGDETESDNEGGDGP